MKPKLEKNDWTPLKSVNIDCSGLLESDEFELLGEWLENIPSKNGWNSSLLYADAKLFCATSSGCGAIIKFGKAL